jgi:predicted Zn-dependent protease
MSAAPRQHDPRTLRSRLLTSAALLVAVAATVACGGPGGDYGPGGDGQAVTGGAGPGHRRQSLALEPWQELQLGEKAYREVLEEERGNVLPPNDPAVRRVRAVGERIVEAAHIEPLEREINLHVDWRYYKWEFNVIRSRQVNAFCLPGGKVVVYTALLRVTGNNDDFLATVLSHEIAHALAHHTSERLAREQGSGRSLRSLAFERWQESEADHIGVFLMTFAGYDPRQAVAFWERMQEMTGGSGVPEILSDHPSDERRIRQLQGWARMAMGAYEAYKNRRIAPAAWQEPGRLGSGSLASRGRASDE